MSYFRINLYLPLKYFFLSFFISENKIVKKIKDRLKIISNKKEIIITSQLRVGFILVLKYLKKKNPNKKEIVISAYNLAEMVSICDNLNLKIVYTKLNKNLFISAKDLRKKINKNTLAVVSTNMFNTFLDSNETKRICKKKKVTLIEDNAIYFGNYKKIKSKKIYAGSFGDYCLNSFNIMKNISAMYGGAVATNDKNFISFANEYLENFKDFPFLKYSKQCFIFFVLKILSLRFFYKSIFFRIIKKASLKNNQFFLSFVYPSLRFKRQNFPNYYYSKITKLSLKMIYLQLMNHDNFNKYHKAKKNNNIYYNKLLSKRKIKGLELVNYSDANFQNFNDFPILVYKKKSLVKYLFSKGIETKTIQYVDCQKIFRGTSKEKLNLYENRVLCLPNHIKIKKSYIDYIVSKIYYFFKNKNVKKIKISS